MAKVTLDMETFKALASETRLSVLRALDERRKTLSELARELELNKATVHEHLQLLDATGLVIKKDEGRKWIYYELSWRGQRLLHPQETTTFSILLGLSIAAAGGGVVVLGRALQWWLAERPAAGLDAPPQPESAELMADTAEDSGGNSEPSREAMAAPAEGNETATPAMDGSDIDFLDDGGVLALLLLVTSLLLAGLAWATMRFRKQP